MLWDMTWFCSERSLCALVCMHAGQTNKQLQILKPQAPCSAHPLTVLAKAGCLHHLHKLVWRPVV